MSDRREIPLQVGRTGARLNRTHATSMNVLAIINYARFTPARAGCVLSEISARVSLGRTVSDRHEISQVDRTRVQLDRADAAS